MIKDPNHNRFYLPADTEDVIIVDGQIAGKTRTKQWVYRGRKINPNVGSNQWYIENFHPNFVYWTFGDVPANPTIEYFLKGAIKLNGRTYGAHPRYASWW